MEDNQSSTASVSDEVPAAADETVSAALDDDGEAAAEAAVSPEVAPPREELRYPLAFDANGNPIKVPPQARAWRVRRGGGKRGRPRNVFDATTGRQLEIPLGASIEDLIATNVPADRYLLYPVDGEGAIIPGVIAVTEVPESDEDDDGDDDRQEGPAISDKDPVLTALMSQQETIKGQHEVIKAQSEYLARALASAVSGYAPVRPVAPLPPPPVIMEAAPPTAPAGPPDNGGLLASLMNVKPEQVMGLFMIVKQAFDMFKGMSGSGMPGVGAAP